MKRLFLIIAILFWCGSLMGQEIKPDNTWSKSKIYLFHVWNNSDPFYKKHTPFESLSDSVVLDMPAKFESSVMLTTIHAVPEPPTSFQLQLKIPIDQIKKKSSPRRDLKAQISQLIAIGTATCLFWRFP